MHGLIFETSIWLLAGSTRYLTGSEDSNVLVPGAISSKGSKDFLRRPPAVARKRSTIRLWVHNSNNFHAVQFVGRLTQCVTSERDVHRRFGPKNAGIRSKISKKVRYHLQSFELGPRKPNWNKKPPRVGRFFSIDANNNRKLNAVAFSIKKKTTGGRPQKKKNHRRERRKPSHPNTDQMSENHRSSQDDSAIKKLEPNRTPQIEPRWFKPLENDSILIFCLFYPYYFLNAAFGPSVLLQNCIFRQVWATDICRNIPFRQDHSKSDERPKKINFAGVFSG